MAVYKRGDVWWYKFTWNGERIRESTKQANKRVAEQMESAHKTSLAKGEVGIRDKKKIPTLKEFAEVSFKPFLQQHCAEKPKTHLYYQNGLKHLLAFPAFANKAMDEIRQEQITSFMERMRGANMAVSSTNRILEVLRRMFKLAMEWGTVEKILPVVRMLPGEAQRDRVLSYEEETKYLQAAIADGEATMKAYKAAQEGIRATMRGEVPIVPSDPNRLRDIAILLIDCGLRPEECYRLRWYEVRDGCLKISHGKTAQARRSIPLVPRAASILEMRRIVAEGSEWVFPASTRSGHIEATTIKKKHKNACKEGGVEYFPPYAFRHTCFTRLSSALDPTRLPMLRVMRILPLQNATFIRNRTKFANR